MIGSGDKGRIFRPVSLDSQKLQEAKCQVAHFTIMSLFFSVWVMQSIQHCFHHFLVFLESSKKQCLL